MTESRGIARWKASLANARAIAVAAVFGLFALLVVVAGLTLPIAGTSVVTDPREVFTTLGAALTGILGGALIGVLAAVGEPQGMALASLVAHVPAGIWMGWAYKRLVYERLPMPWLLAGWFALVVATYALILVPGFVLGVRWFCPATYAESYGAGASIPAAIEQLGRGALPEALITAFLTTLVLLAVPRRHRRPLG